MRVDAAAYRVPGLRKRLKHAMLWDALDPLLKNAAGVRVEEVGLSAEGRFIRAITLGNGKTRVFITSGVHGNEPTGTMGLADLISYLTTAADDDAASTILDNLTITAIPMVNPDGAERFIRQNALGIDLNRDAQQLSSPESRIVLEVYGAFKPHFAFALHDQEPRKAVGESRAPVAFSICAPQPDTASRSGGAAARECAKRVLSSIRDDIEPMVEGHLARYGAPFDAGALDDNFQTWGTSAMLFEAGWWKNDGEKQYMRDVYFTSLVSGLHAIAQGVGETGSPIRFETLPEQGEELLQDLVVRNGMVCVPHRAPYRADLAINYDWPLEMRDGKLVELGDLRTKNGIAEIDATGLYLHIEEDALCDGALLIGAPAKLTARADDSRESAEKWRIEGGAPSDPAVVDWPIQ
jgi:hypothetical protein